MGSPVFLPLFLSKWHWQRAAGLLPKSIVSMASAGMVGSAQRPHFSDALAVVWLCSVCCRIIVDLIGAHRTPGFEMEVMDRQAMLVLLVLQLLRKVLSGSQAATPWATEMLSPAGGYPTAALLMDHHLDELMQVFPLLCALQGQPRWVISWGSVELRRQVLQEALRRTLPWLLWDTSEEDAEAALSNDGRWMELWQAPLLGLSCWTTLLGAISEVEHPADDLEIQQTCASVLGRWRTLLRTEGEGSGSTFNDMLAAAFDLTPKDVASCRSSLLASDMPFFREESRLLSAEQRIAVAAWAIPGLTCEPLGFSNAPLHLVALGPHQVIEPWDLPVALLGRVPPDVHDLVLPGLLYLPEFISETVEEDLLRCTLEAGWQPSNQEGRMARRIHHFGYPYKYPADGIDTAKPLGDLPPWTQPLVLSMLRDGHLPHAPDQLTVNEYLPGQGIAPHVDSVETIGDFIAIVSLGSACVMTFTHCGTRRKHPVLVGRRSLLVMSGAARYHYTHHIAKRKADPVPCLWGSQCPTPGQGTPCGHLHLLPRGRRVSLTFRRIIPAHLSPEPG
eukprot:GGOE01062061.1.p1 GENE.GGOE01062061.1~~GGOE01062061.1.p1  ORF type:complete len:623 (+),score=128.13 GGOE01062061.1:192-1871(+)